MDKKLAKNFAREGFMSDEQTRSIYDATIEATSRKLNDGNFSNIKVHYGEHSMFHTPGGEAYMVVQIKVPISDIEFM